MKSRRGDKRSARWHAPAVSAITQLRAQTHHLGTPQPSILRYSPVVELIIVTRWPLKAEALAAWRDKADVSYVVSLSRPSSGAGRRIGSRLLGLGADSLAVATKARWSAHGRARATKILSIGPWPAAACRAAGFRDIATVGLSVKPGSRAWRALRRSIGDCPVVCHARVETERWVASGGRARTVLYGETFGVSASQPASGRPRIFVGGVSDRDRDAIGALVDENAARGCDELRDPRRPLVAPPLHEDGDPAEAEVTCESAAMREDRAGGRKVGGEGDGDAVGGHPASVNRRAVRSP